MARQLGYSSKAGALCLWIGSQAVGRLCGPNGDAYSFCEKAHSRIWLCQQLTRAPSLGGLEQKLCLAAFTHANDCLDLKACLQGSSFTCFIKLPGTNQCVISNVYIKSEGSICLWC